MSLEVYFGNNLIDEEYYTGLTNSYELFNDSFKLGTTPANIYKLSIAKEGVTNQPSNVILKENNTTFAELEIDNIQEEDYTYGYDLTDKMLDLEFYYDASEIFVNGKTTLLAIAQDICSKAGLTLGTTDFRGYNKEISWYDNRRTAREYIGFIAELNGGFARVENSTLYFRKQKTSSVKTIDIDDCENFIIGEYHKITRVVYELGALKYEFGNETGNTLYLNSDNVFITEESEVQAIYNDIKNFEFYSFETGNCPIDYSVKAGDIIIFTDGTNNYPTIAQYELEYFGTWIGGYSLSVNTERQEETKVVGNTEKIKNLQVKVDRDANTITQLVETTEEIEHQFETLQDIDGFAEGKYIYLDDASDELITSAKFNGETSQEGTPSPDYPSEIENLEGRNKINVQDYSGTLTGYFAVQVTNFKLKEGKTYTFSLDVNSSLGGFNVSVGCGTGAYQRDIKTIQNQQNGRKIITFTPTATDLSYGEDFCFRAPRYTTSQSGVTYSVSNIQLEEGSTATPYAPYNSLEVKVGNKNIFDDNNVNVLNAYLSGGKIITSSSNDRTIYISCKPNTTYTLSKMVQQTTANNRLALAYTNNLPTLGSSFTERVFLPNGTTETNLSITTDNNAKYLLAYVYYQDSNTSFEDMIKSIQIEEGTEVTDYEEHKEQIVYFPLAEGQKLYEGSYLADDGIHNVRGQIVLDGTENWYFTSNCVYTNAIKDLVKKTPNNQVANILCDYYLKDSLANCYNNVNDKRISINNQGYMYIYDTTYTSANSFKTWLLSNPVTVEYELAEEEVIPYNTEQQAAWNSIKSLHTYKTVTHIYSDAYAEIGYIKDNMLSAFETKASANLKYTETTEKFAQQKITNESIENTVSQTVTTVANNYNELKTKFDDYAPKSDVITLQTSVNQIMTDTYTKTEINEKLIDGSVQKVSTTAGTFDSNGLTIEKTNAKTKGRFNETGISVMDATSGTDQELLFAGYDDTLNETIVRTRNITVEKYITLKDVARQEKYVNPVLGGKGIGTFIL